MGWKAAVFVIAPLLLFAPSCAPQIPEETMIEVPCEDFVTTSGGQSKITKAETVPHGGIVVLRLCSNPGTGFAWGDADLSTPAVLAERSRGFVPPEVTMPGAPGFEEWVFEATERGQCTVELSYSRPWEGGEKDVWLFVLQVTVP